MKRDEEVMEMLKEARKLMCALQEDVTDWIRRFDAKFHSEGKSAHWFDRDRNMPVGCPCDRHDGVGSEDWWVDKIQSVTESEVLYSEDHPVFICAEHLVWYYGADMPMKLIMDMRAMGHEISWIDAYNLIRRVLRRIRVREAEAAAAAGRIETPPMAVHQVQGEDHF